MYLVSEMYKRDKGKYDVEDENDDDVKKIILGKLIILFIFLTLIFIFVFNDNNNFSLRIGFRFFLYLDA